MNYNRGREMDLSDLAEVVAARANDCLIEDVSKDQRKRVYVSLYQTHLPAMEKVGALDFDLELDENNVIPSRETERVWHALQDWREATEDDDE